MREKEMLKKIALYSSLMSLEDAQKKLFHLFGEDSNIIFNCQTQEEYSSDFTIIYILTGGVEAYCSRYY